MERASLVVLVGAVPLAALGMLDLATGFLAVDYKMDLVLLAASALVVYSALNLRRIARRMRSGEQTRPPERPWLNVSISLVILVLTLVAEAGFGYVLTGWWLAILLPVSTVLLLSLSYALGVRRRRMFLAEQASNAEQP